jgi:hypothetical protein
MNGIVTRSPNASMAAAAMPSAMIVAPAQLGGGQPQDLSDIFPEGERFDHHAVPFRRRKLERNATRASACKTPNVILIHSVLLYVAGRYPSEGSSQMQIGYATINRHWSSHSLFCSSRTAPISRVMLASLGKMHNVGSTFDFLVQSFQWVGRV